MNLWLGNDRLDEHVVRSQANIQTLMGGTSSSSSLPCLAWHSKLIVGYNRDNVGLALRLSSMPSYHHHGLIRAAEHTGFFSSICLLHIFHLGSRRLCAPTMGLKWRLDISGG